MRPAVALTALALTGAIVVGSVQLVDPRLGDEAPPEVDFSAAPAVVAADAATRLEHVDYTYRLDLADDRGGPWEQFMVVRVDHTNRRYRTVGPLGERGTQIFGNDAVTFARPGHDEAWMAAFVPETTYPAYGVTQPLSISALRNAEGSIVSENASSVLIHLDANPLKVVEGFPGNVSLRIDKRTGVVDEALVTYRVSPDRTRTLQFEVVDVGTIVDRPDGLPVFPKEVFWDLLRGPVFSVGPDETST